MLFTETKLAGIFTIDLEPHIDSRGFFARSFCAKEFEQHGLEPAVVQCNLSFNRQQGTLRGMHCQKLPSQEAKLVRCIAGAILDVVVDLRPGSPTYLSHVAIELSAENRRALYMPAQCAHGFQTLIDNTEVMYQMGDYYAPDYACGYRFDDPAFGLKWPLPISEISEQDLAWPLLTGEASIKNPV
jgi:dTDP-4-dehydrorhamnose 3,5-epimerase